MQTGDAAARNDRRDAVRFVLLAFGLSWMALLPLLVNGAVVRQGVGRPTHLPALIGPAVAAILAAAWSPDRRAQLGDLWARLQRLPSDRTGWLLACSPLAIGGLVVLGLALAGRPPEVDGLRSYSGLPALPPLWVFMIVLLVNGLGEELGWRGYLLPRLQRRFGALRGTALSALVWALWHAPMFVVLASYRGMEPPTILFGFGLGLVSGAFVLAHVTARTGGSVPAVALWHALYNMGAATALGGLVPAATTSIVMTWGCTLILLIAVGRVRAGTIMLPASPLAGRVC